MRQVLDAHNVFQQVVDGAARRLEVRSSVSASATPLARVRVPARRVSAVRLVGVLLGRCIASGRSSLLARDTLDQTRTGAAVCLCLLEAVDDVAEEDWSVLLVLLARPPLDSHLLLVPLLERGQERVDLLFDLVAVRFSHNHLGLELWRVRALVLRRALFRCLRVDVDLLLGQ